MFRNNVELVYKRAPGVVPPVLPWPIANLVNIGLLRWSYTVDRLSVYMNIKELEQYIVEAMRTKTVYQLIDVRYHWMYQ